MQNRKNFSIPLPNKKQSFFKVFPTTGATFMGGNK